METLDEFIARHGIEAEAEWSDSNPNAPDWPAAATHWAVTLRTDEKVAPGPIYFSQGMAHTEEPSAADILDCVALDATMLENAGGDGVDLAVEMGEVIDSAADVAKARKTAEVIEENAEKVRALIGAEAFEALLWDTERP